jgi:hypothetical protein
MSKKESRRFARIFSDTRKWHVVAAERQFASAEYQVRLVNLGEKEVILRTVKEAENFKG